MSHKKLGARKRSRFQPHEKLGIACLLMSYAAAGVLSIIYYVQGM